MADLYPCVNELGKSRLVVASPNLAACLSPFPQLMISYNGFAFSFASWVKTNQYPSLIFKTVSIKLLGLFLFSLWVNSLLDQYSAISFMFLLVSQTWAAVSPFPSWIVTRGGRRSARPGPLTLCQESLKVSLGLSLGCRRGGASVTSSGPVSRTPHLRARSSL